MDSENLQTIQSPSRDKPQNLYQATIPPQLAPAASFWNSITKDPWKLAIGLRVYPATWAVSGKKIIPTEFQLSRGFRQCRHGKYQRDANAKTHVQSFGRGT